MLLALLLLVELHGLAALLRVLVLLAILLLLIHGLSSSFRARGIARAGRILVQPMCLRGPLKRSESGRFSQWRRDVEAPRPPLSAPPRRDHRGPVAAPAPRPARPGCPG